ncbi:hypothetical protein ACH47B_23460 [Rhodococcus sp. NPDC019627]|uniref:hypothetical protein n=1 Tax=unclassified Rhodococcus (in: high G+C Gram-positive bacteria) TaxID=192944 RepID=UPI0033E81F95
MFRASANPPSIGVLKAAQVVVSAVGATVLCVSACHPAGLPGNFVLFPSTFFGVKVGPAGR